MTSTNGLLATGDDRSLRVTVDTRAVEDALRLMPKAAYFRLRDYLGTSFTRFRTTWLRSVGVKFGRGRSDDAIRVLAVNAKKGPPGPKEVAFQVSPEDRRASTPQAAAQMLGRLSAEAYTGNVVLGVHEFGDDIRSSSLMSVPVKTRPGRIDKWKQKYPGRTLRLLPSKKDPRTMALYEVLKKRPRGRPRKGAPVVSQERLRLRWILTRFVDMKPTLRLYQTWDQTTAERSDLFAKFATSLQQDLQRRDPRDL